MPEQEPLPPWADLPSVRPRRTGPGPGDDGDDGDADLRAPDGRSPAERALGRRALGRRALGRRALGRRAAAGRALGGRPHGGRAERAAARRHRRWVITAAALVVVAGGITAAVLLPGSSGPAPVIPDGLITTFQPGELQTVPDACQSVPTVTVQHYLPGQVSVASPLQAGGSAQSACDWTLDHQPVYRLLQLNLEAYAPNGLASGNGSATNAAIDAYLQADQALASPPKDSGDPKATVTALSGLGNEAFSAVQVFRRGGAVTDVATVVVRYHNVVVTATVNGLDHSNRGHYGPVSATTLAAAALAFAQSAETQLH